MAVKFEAELLLWVLSKRYPRLFPKRVKNYLEERVGSAALRVAEEVWR